LVWKLTSAHATLRDFPAPHHGTSQRSAEGAQHPPLLGPSSAHVHCGHGRPSQILLSSCTNGRPKITRRPASADRTARRQFQATGQPVSRTQANDAMTSRLPRYEAKCMQRRCFQWGSVPLCSGIKGTELSPANAFERQLIALQLCR